MKLLGGIAVILFASGCVSTDATIPIKYQFHDFPEEGRIELRFKNELQVPLCLLPESWPNQGGKINQASEYVFLVIDGVRFPIEDFNTGYCPGANGCATRVAPGEEVSASIPYRDFRVPQEMSRLPKKIEFEPVAFKCH